MIGDHQRASHSLSRRVTRVAELLEQRRVRLVPVRALPAGHLVEDRAQRLLARVERREPDVAVGLPLLRRMDDPVHLVEALARARTHVRACLLGLVDAGDVGGVDGDLGVALDHPLGDGLADARALLDPHRGGRPQAGDLGRLAQHRQPVRGHREQPVDRVLHADGLVADDLGHQLERLLHLQLEVGLRERQLGRRERRLLDRGDLVGVVEHRAMRVGADLEAAALLALVHVGVHVAHDRELDADARREARHRADVDHLVDHRRERDRRARHPREARAPDPAADHDAPGLEIAAGRAHAAHASVLDVDAEDLGVGADGQRPGRHGGLAHQRAGLQRVDHAGARRVEPAEDHALVEIGDELADLRRREQRDRLDAPRLRRGDAARELLHALGGARDLDPAALREDPQLAVLADALERQRGHLARVVDREDEVGRVAGRAARVGERPLVDQHELAGAEAREVVHEAVADDARADHDDVGGRRERARGQARVSGHGGSAARGVRAVDRSTWSAAAIGTDISDSGTRSVARVRAMRRGWRAPLARG